LSKLQYFALYEKRLFCVAGKRSAADVLADRKRSLKQVYLTTSLQIIVVVQNLDSLMTLCCSVAVSALSRVALLCMSFNVESVWSVS